jgi:hypothetical protein
VRLADSDLVGRAPWPAADPPVGLLVPELRDQENSTRKRSGFLARRLNGRKCFARASMSVSSSIDWPGQVRPTRTTLIAAFLHQMIVSLLYYLAKGKIDVLEVTALPESDIYGPAIWSFGFGQLLNGLA